MYNFILKIWYQNYLGLGYLLYPFSLIYILIIVIRKYLYQLGIKKIINFNVPVVVIGNLTVGGTGKTPLVIWLTEYLQKKGLKVGIVTRGYKAIRKLRSPIFVTQNSCVTEVGDEALMLAQRLSAPIVVHPNRILAVQKLLGRYSCDVIISDDGLQHYALGRDIEIVVIDEERQFGNGFCLPAGPLREPKSRLKQVNFIVYNNSSYPLSSEFISVPRVFFNMVLKPYQFVSVKDFKTIREPYEFFKKRISAFAGIGNPNRFFNTLKQVGFVNFSKRYFSDHHSFSFKDIDIKNVDFIIMTEKDAVKCRSFADERHYFLKIKTSINSQFGKKIFEIIQGD